MYWLNLIIPALVFIPGLLLYFYPPANVPQESPEVPVYFKVMEWIGRVGLIITPLFSPYSAISVAGGLAEIALIVFLLLYYAGWVRFFLLGRVYEYLYLPMVGVPVPFAISTVLYFMYASFLLSSGLMFVFAIIFAAGHIPKSIISYQSIKMN